MPRDVTEAEWRAMLLGHHHEAGVLRKMRHINGTIPSHPRCKICNVPFAGIGGVIFRMLGKRQFEKNPNFCRDCTITTQLGGVEIELTMLFADVRGSTTLGEKMSPMDFSKLMNRFYKARRPPTCSSRRMPGLTSWWAMR